MALALGATALGQIGDASNKPDIFVIVSDDQGYEDLGCYGSTNIKTPNLNRLAEQGVRCTDFYVPQPLCAPTRSSFLTGRHTQRHGYSSRTTTTPLEAGLDLSEILLGEYLRETGYATAAFGKWNIGFHEGGYPTQRGFDTFYGNPSGGFYFFGDGGDADSVERALYRDTKPVSDKGYGSTLYIDAAIDFMDKNADRPVFEYIAFVAPHVPIDDARRKPWAPPQYINRYGGLEGIDPETNEWWRRNYMASVTAMDAEIGRLLEKIESRGRTRDTLIVFFSDNGGNPNNGASNKPYRGGKKNLLEGGIRVPCIVKWPAALPKGNVCNAPLYAMDLFTLCAQAGSVKLPPESERVIDGKDPMPVFKNSQEQLHDYLGFEFRGGYALRQGSWKIYHPPKYENPEQKTFLYNLDDDPGEKNDLSSEYPDRVRAMSENYANWISKVRKN